MNKKITLATANQLLKEKKYNSAKAIYEKLLLELSNDAPKSLISVIKNNINICNKNTPTQQKIRSKTILAINPSHAHEDEIRFWNEFAKKIKQDNYKLIDLAFRKYESFEDTITVTHSARAHELYKRLKNYAELLTPAWLTDEMIDVTEDWEHRRFEITKYNPEVREGLIRLAKYIDYTIRKINPACIITTNKIDPPNFFSYHAATHHNITYKFIERSPLDTFIIESTGMFAESNRTENIVITNNKYNENQATELINKILKNPYGFRAAEAKKTKSIASDSSKLPILFLPLDNLLWTGWAQHQHNQRKIDYKIFETPEAALTTLNTIAKLNNHRLLIKPHPSCKEWIRIKAQHPELTFTEDDLDYLVNESSAIITFLTKVSYVGAAKGKPVISFGNGLLDDLGITYQVKNHTSLESTIKKAILNEGLTDKISRFKYLIEKINSTFTSNGIDFAKQLKAEIEREKEVKLTEVSDYEIKNSLNRGTKDNLTLPKKFILKDKVNVIFDISRLLNVKLRHSGVSRYVEALVNGITQRPDVNITFTYLPQLVDNGLAAYHFQQQKKQLNIEPYPYASTIALAEAENSPYIYHSPIAPLPPKASKSNGKRVITIHDILHLTMPNVYQSTNNITEKILQSIAPDDGIVFVSEYSRQDYLNYTKAKTIISGVSHLAVSSSFYECQSIVNNNDLNIGIDKKILTFPFQADPRKGFERMVSIANKWRNQENGKLVYIFGKEGNREKCFATIREIVKSCDGFIYMGDPSDELLANLYRRSLAHLYLSDAEGFGLPPLEAMSCYCPSIMPSNTSLTEVYKGWDFMVSKDFPDDEILSKLLAIESNETAIKMSAKKFSLNYQWHHTINSTIELYKMLLN